MIDFVKILLTEIDPEKLSANPLLDFRDSINTRTSEIGNYRIAKYKNLIFKIIDPSKSFKNHRITLEGSLHKFWNDGKHNFNDFGEKELYYVLQELDNLFGIKPKNCELKQLEIGVNLKIDRPSIEIIDSCISHFSKFFQTISVKDEGEYIQAKYQQYIIKLYNKAKQYNKRFKIPDQILRFEIKYCSMINFRKKGIRTLEDILNFKLCNFAAILKEEWDKVVYFDRNVFKGHKFEYKYSSPYYWKTLSTENRRYHRDSLNKTLNENPDNTKNYIGNLIIMKAHELLLAT